MIKAKEFAMYKGEELISIGTLREIAEETGLTHGHIKSLRLTKPRSKKYELVELEED